MVSEITNEIMTELNRRADPGRKERQERYFKTGEDEYGAGDQFRGIRVPDTRKVANQYRNIPLDSVKELLHSVYHEDRLVALLILVERFNTGHRDTKKLIYDLYLNNTTYINNWDLVDTSAEHIVGAYLSDFDKQPLYDLARPASLWKRRIAVVSTYRYIKNNEFNQTLQIADILMSDEEDLIHKAVGWMLREIGKRDIKIEQDFLKTRYKQMPRTMLRYAIEKFPEKQRQAYLKGVV